MNKRRASWTRWIPVVCALYAALLVASYLALRLVGERFWATTLVLYVPGALFGTPLLVLVPLCLHRRRFRALAVLCLSAVFWALLLMDFHGVPGTRSCAETHPVQSLAPVSLRLVTQNAHHLAAPSGMVQLFRELDPDVALLQEADERAAAWWKEQLPQLTWVQRGEFLLGTSLQVVSVETPAPIWTNLGFLRPRYVRYQLEKAGRRVVIYNVHTPSPSVNLNFILHQLRKGGPVSPAISSLWVTTEARINTLVAIAADAGQHDLPVIVAGDTNLPQLSSAFHRVFHNFDDAFACSGWGYGYTFPAYRLPLLGLDLAWLRLDRVLGRNGVHFDEAYALPESGSDHKGLFVGLTL